MTSVPLSSQTISALPHPSNVLNSLPYTVPQGSTDMLMKTLLEPFTEIQ